MTAKLKGRRGPFRLWPLAAALPVCLAAIACLEPRAEEWDPAVAALVDGRPITAAEVNQVISWGLYPQRGPAESGTAEAAVRRAVLEKLIDARLVLGEAERRGLAVGQYELTRAAAGLESPWAGGALPPGEADALRSALRHQRLAHKMTETIMREGRLLSAESWRSFWVNWPRPRPDRYQVRAMFLPPVLESLDSPARNQGDWGQLAEKFKLEGFPVIISEPLWLRSDRLESGLAEALATAWARRRPSGPVRLASCWVIYEVLAVNRSPEAAQALLAARASYEMRAGEEAFRRWLHARRAEADIRINPNLAGPAAAPEGLSPGGLTGSRS